MHDDIEGHRVRARFCERDGVFATGSRGKERGRLRYDAAGGGFSAEEHELLGRRGVGGFDFCSRPRDGVFGAVRVEVRDERTIDDAIRGDFDGYAV